MKKVVVIGSLIIIVLFVYAMKWGRDNSINNSFDTNVEENVKWISFKDSKYFKIEPNIIIKPSKQKNFPYLLWDILIENKTGNPIYNVQATAFLPQEIIPFMYAPLTFFGNTKDERVNLIPGEIPYGLSIGKATQMNYETLSKKYTKDQLIEAVKVPIRIKISHQEDVEYLEIPSSDIKVNYQLNK